MAALGEVMNCIMCGACVSDCTVLEVDKSFLGPAALAKAYRFVGDPRDDTRTSPACASTATRAACGTAPAATCASRSAPRT